MNYDRTTLPPTEAVERVLRGLSPSRADLLPTLSALLAFCYVRDEEDRIAREATDARIVEVLSRPIYGWVHVDRLSVRTANCLANGGLSCLADAWGKSDAELLRLRNFGRRCLTELRSLRASIGAVSDVDLAAALERRPDAGEMVAAYRGRGG